ncbi:dihydrofolate reductase family protein [Brevibacterium aurantiacum]|uniref:Deaminase n=1 Tax=Brevibacterium aurantiacum TaxID=273384 RepID=A0A1D7W7L9_BREAU|nr:dihydrofolate reductase family protein [Brevibacterium aurantiacum]MDN5608832.1 dihydrofolate reductase family protein [Brevibacterium sp.]AOP55043.1 Dihydrofolate reductase [Brevibacterium aurantiacum]AZL06957.1 deaminase [Brevibacterium aurantiacum]AZL14194.1 deaminase [Brevibacterium aurantiacum]MDN5711804.1 dihydrofolate reductase family protein [Brevibacterium aurantiacum]
MTRKLITSLFHSLDGVASAPNLFQFDSFDDDLGQWMTGAINSVDDCVLGRTSYEEWAGYWPNITSGEDTIFADFINSTPKHVASRSLSPEDLTWSNSTLINGDLIEYVRALKEGPGANIAVQGSLSVVSQLLDAELIDELTLAIHPVVAGSGRAIFDGNAPKRLSLTDVQRTSKGNLLVTYAPRQA